MPGSVAGCATPNPARTCQPAHMRLGLSVDDAGGGWPAGRLARAGCYRAPLGTAICGARTPSAMFPWAHAAVAYFL